MGMAGGHVRPPLVDLSSEKKAALRAELDGLRIGALAAMGKKQ
jgi:dihydrodipicolinate synthase/N-acetylneuraminate lyase